MTSPINKSTSESAINIAGKDGEKSSNNYVFQRTKRQREEIDIAEQLDNFKKEMKEMMSAFLTKQINESQQLSETLKEIQQTNFNIESSVTFLMSQNQDLENKISQLESQGKEDKKYIALLEKKIEDMETGNRKTNFVIKNVPRASGESKQDLISMVMCLSQKIDCPVAKCDIKDIYRLRGKSNDNTSTPIIVETGSTILKNDILKSSKTFNIKHKSKLCCKHLGLMTHTDTPIFLSEHLTNKGSRLYFLARDLAKSGSYKYCWTAYGKVYIRKEDHAPIITLTSEEQIHQLMAKA
ncbi:unnamed protein product [Arctia plantaginis]|uniref:FP protein C-terminal domain-containing protein n=1 Tax=Arctia plantaginis TaxID=874455 RepID=A0A8S1B3X3_ARCPL|nr:unnamed protein product [Arctia plantaginis]